jgi:hypothetical protein
VLLGEAGGERGLKKSHVKQHATDEIWLEAKSQRAEHELEKQLEAQRVVLKQRMIEAEQRKATSASTIAKPDTKEKTLSGMVKAGTNINLDGGFSVRVNIYDLGPVSKWVLNSWTSAGMFHCGVEFLGVEVSFQGIMGRSSALSTGVTWHAPKLHPRHVYRESLDLGQSRLRLDELAALLESLEKGWPLCAYDFMLNNCTDFAEQLVLGLRTPIPFPAWIHGIAKVGKTMLADIPAMKSMSCMDPTARCVDCKTFCRCDCDGTIEIGTYGLDDCRGYGATPFDAGADVVHHGPACSGAVAT